MEDLCNDQGIDWSRNYDFAVLPQFINSENMFNMWQRYQTTEYMLGKKRYSPLGAIDVFSYNGLPENVYVRFDSGWYGRLVKFIRADYSWYEDVEIEVLGIPLSDLYTLTGPDNHRSHILSHNFERWLFKKLYNR